MAEGNDRIDIQALSAAADRMAAAGDLRGARQALDQLSRLAPQGIENWMRLSAVCRRLGDAAAALDAISGALRVDPLAFLPLLLKADLLDQLGRHDDAGETYGYALAQKPDSVPPQLQPVIAKAEAGYARYQARREAALNAAQAATNARLTAGETRQIARFCANIVRRTQVYHSEPSHFFFPGLREREFHDREVFPALDALEAATDAIRADFERVVAAERAQLVPYVQYPDDVPVRQWAQLNRNRDWTAIHLIQNGVVIEDNARHCPATMEAIAQLDQPHVERRGPNAMFSLLAPGAHIPPHLGVANTRLVCHLPLVIPPGCWFRVGAETREWQVGKAWVFDDTIEHEAMNAGTALRVILIVDLWHPDLSAEARKAVGAILSASDARLDGPL